MTFAMPYIVAERPVEPEEPGPPENLIALPEPLAVIHVDFDAITDGDGSYGSPYNALRGASAGDTDVEPGTRVKCRGVGSNSTGNFGRLLRAGTALNPVVYVGNDPDWGSAILDGSIELDPVACEGPEDAFGAASWASLRRADITGIGGDHVDDYLHCAYGGALRRPRFFAGYPQLPNAQASDYNQYAPAPSWADVFWKPGQPDPTAHADYEAGVSRPRLQIAAANTAMGLEAGTLEAALDADAAPIIYMRVYANTWFVSPAQRCDADGTPNVAGDYLKALNPLTGAMGSYTDVSFYRFRILNLAHALDGPGQYAMNPAKGWLLDWPEDVDEPLFRACGASGLQIAAEHVWVVGFQLSGMSRTATVSLPAGAAFGDSLSVSGGIDSTTVRLQQNHFTGFGSIGRPSNRPFFDRCGHAARYLNTYEDSLNGGALTFSGGAGADLRWNEIRRCAGGISNLVGHGRNVTIEANLIEDINDVHGNGLALYINKYGYRVRHNVFRNVDRPIVSEKAAAAYDEEAYGAPSCLFEANVIQASGVGTAAALRWQSAPTEKGLSLIDNKLDGGASNHTPFLVHPDLVAADNGPVTGNVGVGGAANTRTAELWASGDNVRHARASAEGLALIAEIAAMTAPSEDVAPYGVGHLGGL